MAKASSETVKNVLLSVYKFLCIVLTVHRRSRSDLAMFSLNSQPCL